MPIPPKHAAGQSPALLPAHAACPGGTEQGGENLPTSTTPQGSSLQGALGAGVLLQQNFKVARDKAFNVFA